MIDCINLTDAELLLETRVNSSWMQDIIYRGRHNTIFPDEELILFKTKKSPKVYICRGLNHQDYLKWLNAPSKGKYFRVIQQEYDNTWFEYKPEFTIVKFSKITEPTRNRVFAKVKNQTWKLTQRQRSAAKPITRKELNRRRIAKQAGKQHKADDLVRRK